MNLVLHHCGVRNLGYARTNLGSLTVGVSTPQICGCLKLSPYFGFVDDPSEDVANISKMQVNGQVLKAQIKINREPIRL